MPTVFIPNALRGSGRPVPWIWPVLLVLCAVLLRIALLDHYPSVSFPDSATYVQAARDLVSGDYSVGMARRTPGYPLAIVLTGESAPAVVRLQAFAGVLTSVLLYFLTYRLSGLHVLAFGVGLAHSLSLQQLFLETALLTESLSAFSVVATLAAFSYALTRLATQRSAVAWLLLSSGLAGYALLVRPQFIFFVALLPLLAAFAVAGWRPSRASVSAALLVALPAVVAVLGWAAVVQQKVGPFALSTQAGFGFVNHVHDDIEFAPDEFATVREILRRTRDARLLEAGHARNTVWYAWPDIQRATGWTLPQASRELRRMSIAIIQRRPLHYARSVASAWVDFWTVPNFWQPEKINPPALRQALTALWWVEHKLLRASNLAFVVLVAGVAVLPRWRRALRWDVMLTALSASVLLSSVIQALADQGASSRYAVPTQSLVVLVLAVAWARFQQTRRGGTGQP